MADLATTHMALTELVVALKRRTDGLTDRQFESMVSPAVGAAFVNAWHALSLDPNGVPEKWQDMANTYAEIG